MQGAHALEGCGGGGSLDDPKRLRGEIAAEEAGEVGVIIDEQNPVEVDGRKGDGEATVSIAPRDLATLGVDQLGAGGEKLLDVPGRQWQRGRWSVRRQRRKAADMHHHAGGCICAPDLHDGGGGDMQGKQEQVKKGLA